MIQTPQAHHASSRSNIQYHGTDAGNIVPCSAFKPSGVDIPDASGQYLRVHFIRHAILSPRSLNGLFLVACRHLSMSTFGQKSHFLHLALQYKITCARSLAEDIASTDTRAWISDSTVTLALFLAQDEVRARLHKPASIAGKYTWLTLFGRYF